MENPDKTTNPEFYENGDMTERECQGLDDVITYAVSSHKTQQVNEELGALERFVSGINCNPSTAREEMMAVKKRFGKEDGTIAYHGYQSFAPGEATPEIAHKIGVELAQRLWGDRYQVVVATHLDKENHLHNHFVLNTVSFVDGIKYHRTAKDYRDIFALSAELENEAIAMVMESFPAKDEFFQNPMYFLTELPKALDVNKEFLFPLFHDNFDKLFSLLEKQLKNCYGTADSKEEEDILLTFAIGGTLHTLRTLKYERNCDDVLLAERMAQILSKVNELRIV